MLKRQYSNLTVALLGIVPASAVNSDQSHESGANSYNQSQINSRHPEFCLITRYINLNQNDSANITIVFRINVIARSLSFLSNNLPPISPLWFSNLASTSIISYSTTIPPKIVCKLLYEYIILCNRYVTTCVYDNKSR